MSEKRDAYVEKLKARLDRWNTQIDELEARARQIQTGTREEVQKQIENAKASRAEFEERVETLRKAGDGAWKDLRKGVKASWKALDKSVRSAAAKFKKAPPQTPPQTA